MFASFAFILKGTNGREAAVRSGRACSVSFETNNFAYTIVLYPYHCQMISEIDV